MTTRDLTPEQLEELRPLAAVIEGAITDTPIRLGTDDWGTALAATILARVAAYMGGVTKPPAVYLPTDDDALRAERRDSITNLFDRLRHRGTLTEAEATLLYEHVETEIRAGDAARAVAAGNLRHVQLLFTDLTTAQAATERVRRLVSGIAQTTATGISDYDIGRHDLAWAVLAILDGTEQATSTEPS